MPTATERASDTQRQLGAIVRQLHDAMQSLGYDQTIRQIATEIPDARDRLAYVGGMTEAAANKVLNLVDAAAPACDEIAAQARGLNEQLDRLLGGAGADPHAPVLQACAAFTQRTSSFAETQRSTLTDIMLTQDFQDLSGQVIGKVIEIISRTERQLVDLLVQGAQAQEGHASSAELAGPQVPDKAMQQDDVDDLLAAMGF
ncbi:protein phosphatase CheZ [Sphaerotilus mobilis]|uniref:Protein phosphatase CheZ n=1 Tax=Sphaerotilus mobilis TaxID=47994 RepID=A0A4Q7LSB1_9BURK|nr:protein phosphatase CheZ [Sphaerotilus mobilis]RZS57167.1 chemotaxis protein CheZ [Sphaerotilus mobilis]